MRFDELTPEAQIRRLRHSSSEVLRKYDIAEPTLQLLAHHRQATFRVRSQVNRECYLLRYHQSDYGIPTNVRSEFHWLRSLRKHTGVPVPEPVATLEGEDVPRVAMNGVPDGLHCSMLRWLEGKRYFRRRGPGVRVLREVGRIMAEMHRHAEGFVPPGEFQPPVWDYGRIFEDLPPGTAEAEREILDPNGRRLFRLAQQRVRRAMDSLGTGRDVFGMIHGDLIQANYIIHAKQVRVIDFADCGLGYFLYDLGITLFGLWGLDEDESQRRAFLEGYRAVRTLPSEQERMLDLFVAARAVVQGRFVMTSAHPADRRMAPQYIRKVLDGLAQWLR